MRMGRYCLSIVLAIILLLTGCSQNAPAETWYPFPTGVSTLTNDQLFERYFDLDKRYHPTEEDIHSIVKYMPIAEVVAILGKPHGGAPTGRPGLSWETDIGNTYYFNFNLPEYFISGQYQSGQNTIELIMKYGFCEAGPYLLPSNENTESTEKS